MLRPAVGTPTAPCGKLHQPPIYASGCYFLSFFHGCKRVFWRSGYRGIHFIIYLFVFIYYSDILVAKGAAMIVYIRGGCHCWLLLIDFDNLVVAEVSPHFFFFPRHVPCCIDDCDALYYVLGTHWL